MNDKISVHVSRANENEQYPSVPFFATYDDSVIFVTVWGEIFSSGYMVNENSAHQPFEYFTKEWITKELTPFHGDIRIHCP